MVEAAHLRRVERAAGPLVGTVLVPGSKSESQRLMVLNHVSSGRLTVEGALASDDTEALRIGLRAVDAAQQASPAATPARIDARDGGTPARFLMAYAAARGRCVTIDGSPRLRQRPMADGIQMLRSLGAQIVEEGEPGRLPITIRGRAHGGGLEVGRIASSQFVSALVLVGPMMEGGVDLHFTEPITSESYVHLTLDALAKAGVPCATERAEGRLTRAHVRAATIGAGSILVEADASSAAYWWLAGAIIPGSRVVTQGVTRTSRQPDAAVHGVLLTMGAKDASVDQDAGIAYGDGLRGADVDARQFPDGALAVAAAMAAASGPSQLTGLSTLRGKESDRIAAMAQALRMVGCSVHEGEDSLAIEGMGWAACAPSAPRDALIDSHNDHRIAMAMAILGMCRGGIAIGGPECVAKSYPAFWDDVTRMSEGAA